LGLRTWSSHTLVKNGRILRVTAMPGQHGPGVFRHLLPPVMGSMLEFGPATGDVESWLYISGDTLVFDGVREIPQRYPDIPFAVLHLGATTLPGGLLVTMDEQQGCDLLEILAPRQAVPIHLDDYDVFKFSLEKFQREVESRGLADIVRYVEPGQTVSFSSAVPAHSR
ncbi:MAG: MBL fold metallo-hydrolase, partial [Actinobacteria bacterium]|nr:MBL fold metallo-hydrolase [Actinomycetota bacterium]